MVSPTFPGVLFTQGEPSHILDFDIGGGEQGAYELLELDSNDYDKSLHKRAKKILLEELEKIHKDRTYLSKRLAAVAAIACIRSPGENLHDAPGVGRWNSLLALILATEAQAALSRISLPFPEALKRLSVKELGTSPPLLPPMMIRPVQSGAGNARGDFSIDTMTLLSKDDDPSKVDILIGGQLSSDMLGAAGSVTPSRHLGSAVLPLVDDALRLIGNGTQGSSGISRSQLKQLTRQSSILKGRLQLFNVRPDGKMVPQAKRPKRKEAVKTPESPQDEEEDWDAVQKQLVELTVAQEELQSQVDVLLMREEARSKLIDVSAQTDAVPPPDPLIITRPSSPVFLPALPSSEKELELLEEVDKLKEDVRVHRAETEKVKAHLRTTTLENNDLHLRLQSSDSLLSLIHHTRPLVSRVCKRFEPLTAVLPVAAVDWATKKGMKAVEGIVQREESEIGRLRREVGQLERQLEAVNATPSALARSTFLTAGSTHPLSASSGRAAYATRRLGEQVKALTQQVREMREENVDLIVQLSQ